MPTVHAVPVAQDVPVFIVNKDGVEQRAHVLQRDANTNRYYVHYLDKDKRMDEWVPGEQCSLAEGSSSSGALSIGPAAAAMVGGQAHGAANGGATAGKKRKRGGGAGPLAGGVANTGQNGTTAPGGARFISPRPPQGKDNAMPAPATGGRRRGGTGKRDELAGAGGTHVEEVLMTEEDYDLEQHKKITAKRNFEDVYFGDWKIKTWYYSPYPLTEFELEEIPQNSTLQNAYNKIAVPTPRPAGGRSRARASDLFAGALNKQLGPELPNLWVCDKCLKYFSEAFTWEVHKVNCQVKEPPGKLVYKRGAHAIREIDGSVDKLYCQNLSLFGKLFIDVKTLYFDTDNFTFYVLTNYDERRDHLVGFFSKEKHSFDDYNLACIMTLPHYQKKGFGMLMIEFSYELSRRAKKVGSPERPLSDLGLRSYLAYWVATIIRFFRHVLTALPPAANGLIVQNQNQFPDVTKPTPGFVIDPDVGMPGKKRKARSLPPVDVPITPFDELDDDVFSKHRVYETTVEPDGSARTHVLIECTLGDIARATNLRLDDAAFALNECGLITKRLVDVDGSSDTIVVTRELVEKVAKDRNVKQMCMDLRYVCIDCPPRDMLGDVEIS